MPIQTKRLILRPYHPNDFQMLRELDGDPAVLRYRSRKQISPEMTREFLDKAQQSMQESPRLFYAYAVVRRENLEWLGQCGLTVLPPEVSENITREAFAKEAFAWYSLLPRFWGQGIMGEAVQALLVAGASEFKLHRIFAECHPDNRASERVMEKAGMKSEGRVQIPGVAGERIRYGLEGNDLKQIDGTNIRIERPL